MITTKIQIAYQWKRKDIRPQDPAIYKDCALTAIQKSEHDCVISIETVGCAINYNNLFIILSKSRPYSSISDDIQRQPQKSSDKI